MDCNCAKELINLYVDNMLSDTEKEELMQHVCSCAQCKKSLDETLALKEALSGLKEIEPPKGLAVSAIKKAKKSKVPTFAFISAGAAAVILLIVVFASGVLPGDGGQFTAERAQEPMAFMETDQATEMGGTNEAKMMIIEDAESAEEMAEDSLFAQSDCTEEEAVDESVAEVPTIEESAAEESDRCQISITVDQKDVKIAIEQFIENNKIDANFYENRESDVLIFTLDDNHYNEFESLLLEEGIGYSGTLYPNCLVEITFLY